MNGGDPDRWSAVAADGELRPAGGLEKLFADGGLDIVIAGLVDAPWDAADDEVLLRGVLLGEDPLSIETKAPTVIDAARRFRTQSGSYHLDNAFRYALGRVPAADAVRQIGALPQLPANVEWA